MQCYLIDKTLVAHPEEFLPWSGPLGMSYSKLSKRQCAFCPYVKKPAILHNSVTQSCISHKIKKWWFRKPPLSKLYYLSKESSNCTNLKTSLGRFYLCPGISRSLGVSLIAVTAPVPCSKSSNVLDPEMLLTIPNSGTLALVQASVT